ncbi:MAG: carboxymuconolactone decarboxylase family protein [Steroidobacteraceae bacterium]|nr:carboxymuconolactone decarboxylase family protein [Steroidobacteraceae bacterium]
MSGSNRRSRGVAMMQRVYADVVPVPPEGQSAFAELMLEQLFAEVWTRDALSVRDRRLLTMGVIAALGEPGIWGIQVRAALANGEITAEQAREMLIHLAPYAGYPRVSGLLRVTEEAIATASSATP